ncbi:laccase LAC5-4-like protein [Oryza sativa Japonica Group]|uniref:Laccase LAC5-4-like protein n=2 Tax=Oryza sativa subsp. japonica TaxID=39947 RepID=Q5N9S6_ORYSJ|nr:laccase-7 isoform 2 precursor [Oryza sativa Japonica Group]KAB8084316.1 hypothetical protein EE612_006848 [Oryza sativa]BAD81780.1 laccase LAC5-4-like protein [Oryza sativa Japonica Group]BAD82648.1 laccase LAC5-4-like protein [Oryza sativa Japonica Group]BAG88126.1 unnamed protein product [Oryza sativa Japonica Group]BAS75244.1 Os01g0850700 [Oryza sativa Japonica Group]
MVIPWCSSMMRLLWFLFALLLARSVADAATANYTFTVESMRVSRLCNSTDIIAVNGLLPGPMIEVNEGDAVAVEVINGSPYNLTIHWHGILQLLTPWADGPSMVTQCPIQPNSSYTYRFNVTGQEGTLWWHAHSSFLRATVYGALIIRPRNGSAYPFPAPDQEVPIVLGEWWSRNVVDIESDAVSSGQLPRESDAFTVNGVTGELYQCATQHDGATPGHQRWTQHAPLLQGGRPRVHRRGRRRVLHRQLHHGHARARAGAHRGRAHGHQRVGRQLLHGGAGVRQPVSDHHGRNRRHHRHGHRALQHHVDQEKRDARHAHHAPELRLRDGQRLLLRAEGPAVSQRAGRADQGGREHDHRAGPRPAAVRLHTEQLLGEIRRGGDERRVVPPPVADVPPGGAVQPHAGGVHRRLPGRPAAERHADGRGDQGAEAQVQLDGGDRAAEPDRLPVGEPPDPPPRLQLLRAGPGPRQLHAGQRERLQPRRPGFAQHPRRADRRLGRHPFRCQQSRHVVLPLPP